MFSHHNLGLVISPQILRWLCFVMLFIMSNTVNMGAETESATGAPAPLQLFILLLNYAHHKLFATYAWQKIHVPQHNLFDS
jgi:hypothetical protein